MVTKLFVGNLSWGTDSQKLEEFFSQAGEVVSAFIVKDRETKRSRGFGFVEFANAEDAAKALEMFDGAELDGREIKVAEAKENDNRDGAPRPAADDADDMDDAA